MKASKPTFLDVPMNRFKRSGLLKSYLLSRIGYHLPSQNDLRSVQYIKIYFLAQGKDMIYLKAEKKTNPQFQVKFQKAQMHF